MAQTVSAQEHAAAFSNKMRSLALVIVAFAFVMDLLDTTIVNVAIPSIQASLHASYGAIQWIVAGYSLTFALLLVTGGRMGDVYGYKKLFMVGVGGFTQPGGALDFGNSGTGCRLAIGAVAGAPITAIFSGDDSLRSLSMTDRFRMGSMPVENSSRKTTGVSIMNTLAT